MPELLLLGSGFFPVCWFRSLWICPKGFVPGLRSSTTMIFQPPDCLLVLSSPVHCCFLMMYQIVEVDTPNVSGFVSDGFIQIFLFACNGTYCIRSSCWERQQDGKFLKNVSTHKKVVIPTQITLYGCTVSDPIKWIYIHQVQWLYIRCGKTAEHSPSKFYSFNNKTWGRPCHTRYMVHYWLSLTPYFKRFLFFPKEFAN